MRWYRAPAKLNLTLTVVGRRLDGFHDIESLTAFAGESDWLGHSPGQRFELAVEGSAAPDTGPLEDNLVARAARAFSARAPDALTGRFRLIKRLPAAAGLGGGSSDAAACIRALAEANGMLLSDERVQSAALETGSDVPVCVSACARVMRGVGDRLSAPVRLPSLFAVLVNPRQALATRDVFAALGLERGFYHDALGRPPLALEETSSVTLETVVSGGNDLEIAAQRLLPSIADVLEALKRVPGVIVARMSGSGATCFGLFETLEAASRAHARLVAERPGWWIATTALR